MHENYTEAAERHQHDAKLLDKYGRLDNADQLYGFAAECALKAALVQLGRFRDDQHKVHINDLWDKMQATSFQLERRGAPGPGAFPDAEWAALERAPAAYRLPAIVVHIDKSECSYDSPLCLSMCTPA